MGATHTTGTNLYLTLCEEEGSKLAVLDTDGDEFEILEIPAPRQAKPAKPASPGASLGASLRANVVPFPRKG